MIEDEGYELAKAFLMRRERLYSPVWCDQPPLHAGLLDSAALVFGRNIVVFRVLTGVLLLVSLCMLAACVSPSRRLDWVKFTAVALASSSIGFVNYGLSVTIMLPAIGFGLASVWLWKLFESQGNRWCLFGSGVLLGFGFQTKFTVLLLLPALAVEFIRLAWERGKVLSLESQVLGQNSENGGMRNAESMQDSPSSRPSPPLGARGVMPRALKFFFQWSAVWLGGFLYGVALVWAFFPEEDLVWLLKYHFRPEVTEAFRGQAGLPHMLHTLGMDWPIAGFAVLGLFLGLVQRRWAVVFPTLFFATSFLAHAWHRPYWNYYYLHLSIPMAWLGALGIQWTWETLVKNAECGMRSADSARASLAPTGGEGLRVRGQAAEVIEAVQTVTANAPSSPPSPPVGEKEKARSVAEANKIGWGARLREFRPGWRAAGLIAAFSFCLAGFVVDFPERWQRETAFLRAKPSESEQKVLAMLKERQPETRWLYTDRPIWCAHANILIPPELAVLSLKRIASGDITHADFLRLLYHYRPEQIVLQRRHFEDEKFHEFLRAFYDMLLKDGNLEYYVRRDWEAARKARSAPPAKAGQG